MLTEECGDFIIRRSDGVFAYQLAVVVDDGLSGATEVVRGHDLIGSTPRQIWLYELFGFTPPKFIHMSCTCRTCFETSRKIENGKWRMENYRKGFPFSIFY